jgi:hypothetical protein
VLVEAALQSGGMVSAFERELRAADVPRSARRLAATGITRSMTRGPSWRRTSRGFFVPAGEVSTPAQRIVDAAPLIPIGGALAGWAAAYVHGVDVLDGRSPISLAPLPITICLGSASGRTNAASVRYTRDLLPSEHQVIRHALPVTSAVRTAFDGGRWASDLVESVVFIDQIAHALDLDVPALTAFSAEVGPVRGVRQFRRALEFVDAASASPWESRLRMFYMLRAGLPRPQVNIPVFTLDGKFVGIPDLLDVEAGLATEFDGQDHRKRRQHRDDNLREEGLEEVNLVVCRVDSLDMRSRLALSDRLQRRYAQGMRRDRSQDAWTLQQPEWWRRRWAS